MGLLDDAIREHLDLKRRRGADPAEIERSEREALGPVRRAPEGEPEGPGVHGDEPSEFDPQVAAPNGQEYEYEEEDEYDEGPEHEAAYPEDAASPEDAHETQLYEAEPPEYEPPSHEPLDHVHEPEPEPPAPAYEPEPPAYESEPPPPHPAPDIGHVGQETVEYDLADHPEAADHLDTEEHLEGEHPEGEPREGEDMLEETPEFLQDTPEHDRLWFEQRPPRDFDFDG